MSCKDVHRELILLKVKDRQINLTTASNPLGLSYPQTKRIWSSYLELQLLYLNIFFLKESR